ncbi:MAG: hypothetical protein ACI81Q_001882 [Paracoccaceae bacterium]|jgi:hypothetical protein
MPDVTPTAANVGQAKGDKHVLTAGIERASASSRGTAPCGGGDGFAG